jgi:hypothetical protein
VSCPLIANLDRIRVTRVDGCGRPVCGPGNAFTTDCLASVSFQANVQEGTDVQFRAANGRVCGFKRGCPSFQGYNVTATIFAASPELIEIMTGSPVYFGHDGTPIGFDSCSIPCNSGFSLEAWAEVLGEDVCEDEAGEGAWVYMLLPWVTNGQLGDLELGSEGVNLTLTGATRAGGGWGVGPYDVQAQDAAGTPGPMLQPLGSTCHRRTFVTSVAPPEPECEYQDVVCATP